MWLLCDPIINLDEDTELNDNINVYEIKLDASQIDL